MTSKETTEVAPQAASILDIQDVRVVSIDARTRVRHPREIGLSTTIPVEWTVRPGLRSDELFHVAVSMRVRILPKDQSQTEGPPPVSIFVELELRYGIPPGTHVTDQALNEFVVTSGVSDAWPFLREVIRDISTRMNLPPLVLPQLRRTFAAGGARAESEKHPKDSAPKVHPTRKRKRSTR